MGDADCNIAMFLTTMEPIHSPQGGEAQLVRVNMGQRSICQIVGTPAALFTCSASHWHHGQDAVGRRQVEHVGHSARVRTRERHAGRDTYLAIFYPTYFFHCPISS